MARFLGQHQPARPLGVVGGLVHYPDPEARELRAALAGAYETPEDTFVLGNGAAELFYLFFEVERPKRVLLPVPSFSEYERAALASGADVEYFLLREKSGFAIDCDALLDDVRETPSCSATRTTRRGRFSRAKNSCASRSA